MAVVYRIEHEKTGAGIYTAGSWADEDGLPLEDTDRYYELAVYARYGGSSVRYPKPCDDGFGHVSSQYRFGFATVEQLVTWFDEDFIAEVAEMHFAASVYEVEERWLQRGGRQVAFRRDKATLLRRAHSYAELVENREDT